MGAIFSQSDGPPKEAPRQSYSFRPLTMLPRLVLRVWGKR